MSEKHEDMRNTCSLKPAENPERSLALPTLNKETPMLAWHQHYYSSNESPYSNIFIPNTSNHTVEGAISYKVAFLLDITGSMETYIDGTKKQIRNFIDTLQARAQETIQKQYKDANVPLLFEVAILGYRDFDDKVHFETLDFTSDLGTIEAFLTKLRADGGDDEPEDVKGAFIHALFGVQDVEGIPNVSKRLCWDESNKNVISRSLIWLADAPPHGRAFANPMIHDNHPDPHTHEWVSLFRKIQEMDLDLYVMKIVNQITPTVQKMKELIEENKLDVDIKEVDVTLSVHESCMDMDAFSLYKEESGFSFGSYGGSGAHFEASTGYHTMSQCMSQGVEERTTKYMSTAGFMDRFATS